MTRRAVVRHMAGAAVISGLLLPNATGGQTVPEEVWPSFEVASVKKITDSNGRLMMSGGQGGRLLMSGLPLRTLILQAYGIRSEQLIGGPGWITSDRFTINAKAETNVPRDQLLLMLRSLLAERFKLRLRPEQREVTAYVLTRLKPDGPLGPKLRQSPCPDPRAAAGLPPPPPPGGAPSGVAPAGRGSTAPPKTATAGAPTPVPGRGAPPAPFPAAQSAPPAAPSTAGPPPAAAAGRATASGEPARSAGPSAPAAAVAGRGATAAAPRAMSSLPGVPCGSLSLSSGLLRGGGVPFSTLASLMSSSVGAQVVDRTGLTGIVDAELEFALGGSLQAAAPGVTVPTTNDAPSIFAAVQDLGLKLERRREKVDSYVIESVEQPDED
jgi:uncharacterized protein (TIGR03435 family)